MATIIYPAPIFGPVKSRRLGISLGINLMPMGRYAPSTASTANVVSTKISARDCLVPPVKRWLRPWSTNFVKWRD